MVIGPGNDTNQQTYYVSHNLMDAEYRRMFLRDMDLKYKYVLLVQKRGIFDLPSMKPPLSIEIDVFTWQGKPYNKDYPAKDSNSVCVTMSDRYHWGFSAWTLIFMVALQGCWCFLLLFLYIYCKKYGRRCSQQSYLSELKAILELGHVMLQGIEGSPAMTASELKENMRRDVISYQRWVSISSRQIGLG